jgi:hypothetical protein
MTSIVLLLPALMFGFGVLTGSVLHAQAVHREYWWIAERVRELPESQGTLAEQKTRSGPGKSHQAAWGVYRVTIWQLHVRLPDNDGAVAPSRQASTTNRRNEPGMRQR